MDYWKNNGGTLALALERKVWGPTPWVIDVRSPCRDDEFSNAPHRMDHVAWLRANIGTESWSIYGKPGDWNFAGATVNGETWLGFRTEEQMQRFCAAFPQSVIQFTAQEPKP
jgi:hypothetical protein